MSRIVEAEAGAGLVGRAIKAFADALDPESDARAYQERMFARWAAFRQRQERDLGSGAEFTDEQKRELEKLEFRIYKLEGLSVEDLKRRGVKFFSTLDTDSDIAQRRSLLHEVAVPKARAILPYSENASLYQQEEIVDTLTHTIASKVEGVKAVIADFPEYLEIAYQNYTPLGRFDRDAARNNRFLFEGSKVRTRTCCKYAFEEMQTITVGEYEDASDINLWMTLSHDGVSSGSYNVVIPLIVPEK